MEKDDFSIASFQAALARSALKIADACLRAVEDAYTLPKASRRQLCATAAKELERAAEVMREAVEKIDASGGG